MPFFASKRSKIFASISIFASDATTRVHPTLEASLNMSDAFLSKLIAEEFAVHKKIIVLIAELTLVHLQVAHNASKNILLPTPLCC
jgi:hypothetical protein